MLCQTFQFAFQRSLETDFFFNFTLWFLSWVSKNWLTSVAVERVMQLKSRRTPTPTPWPPCAPLTVWRWSSWVRSFLATRAGLLGVWPALSPKVHAQKSPSFGSALCCHHFEILSNLWWRRKWQPTPVFLPGESQGRGSLGAAVYGVAQSRTLLKWLSSSSSNLWKSRLSNYVAGLTWNILHVWSTGTIL